MSIEVVVVLCAALLVLGGAVLLLCLTVRRLSHNATTLTLKMSDQLVANSDWQLRRIDIEAQSAAAAEYTRALAPRAFSNGAADYPAPPDGPEVVIRGGGGP